MGKQQTLASVQRLVGPDALIAEAVGVQAGPMAAIMISPIVAGLATTAAVLTDNIGLAIAISVAFFGLLAFLFLRTRILIVANSADSVFICRSSRRVVRATEVLLRAPRPLTVERSPSLRIHEKVVLLGDSYTLARLQRAPFDRIIGADTPATD